MSRNESVIHSDPAFMGGTPVFVGTRVPLATLLDYLEAGQPLAEFLEDFPTVTREQEGSGSGAGQGGAPRQCASCVMSAFPGASNVNSSAMTREPSPRHVGRARPTATCSF
jgi:hypothetical protein